MLWNSVAAAARGEGSLADLPLRTDAWVYALRMDADAHEHSVLLRLLEIGFLPGEPVRVVARAAAGGDPLAVRVGCTTFALRRCEASLVRVGSTPPDLSAITPPGPPASTLQEAA